MQCVAERHSCMYIRHGKNYPQMTLSNADIFLQITEYGRRGFDGSVYLMSAVGAGDKSGLVT